MEDTRTEQDKAFLDAYERVSEIHRIIVQDIRRNPQPAVNDRLVLTPLESILNFAQLIDINSYEVNEADLEKQIAVVTRGLLDIVAICDREMPEIGNRIKADWLDKFVRVDNAVIEKINTIVESAGKKSPENEATLTSRMPILPPLQGESIEGVNRWLSFTPFLLAMLVGLVMITSGIFIFPSVHALVISGIIMFVLGVVGMLVRQR